MKKNNITYDKNISQSRDISYDTFKKALKRLGIRNFILVVVGVIYNRIFDIFYNVDTFPHMDQKFLIKKGLKKSNLNESARYDESSFLSVKKLFSSINIKENDILLEVGCGKGIVMMAALHHNFSEIRGFDHSKYLCNISKKNLDIYSSKINSKKSYNIFTKSALDFKFKGDETVLYFYNPFNEKISFQFLKALKDSLKKSSRKVKIISRAWNCENIINEYFEYEKIDFSFWGKKYSVYKI